MTSDQEANLDATIMEAAQSVGLSRYLPFLTEEHLGEFESRASSEEKSELEEWFGVEQIYNPKPSNHVLSTCLFWKNADLCYPELPEPTMSLLQDAWKLGIAKRFDPWAHYVLPLLEGAKRFAEAKPDVTVRVYLANDLAFLLPELVKHCEVYLMKHSSIRHNPGAMWRYLALEDAPGLVTLMDADLLDKAAPQMQFSETSITEDIASWRIVSGMDCDRLSFIYRPIPGSRFGSRLRLPMRQLAQAFVWHSRRNTFPKEIDFPGRGVIRRFGTTWPGYGIDESFLSAAVYPRLLKHGMAVLTRKAMENPTVYPLDMALTKTANSASYAKSI